MIKQEQYITKREFEKQSNRMIKKGWAIINLDVKKERPCACCLLGLFSWFLPSVDVYYVTYQK